MTVAAIKQMIRNRIAVDEMTQKDKRQNGETGEGEEIALLTLRDILQQIEAFELDEY